MSDRPKLLDLYSGAGGAARGYQRAGFYVVGVDNKPQPHYCGDEFFQADALAFLVEHGHRFDVIHASPPCQSHTALRTMHNARRHADMVAATRILLRASGKPYVIENVVGAPLIEPVMLCGTMFNLGVDDAELRRHRLFESNVAITALTCQHGTRDACVGLYGGHVRNRKRRTIGVYGKGARDSNRKVDKGVPDFTADQGRTAMGIDWMSITELSQALPPAYTEHVGRQLLRAIGAKP